MAAEPTYRLHQLSDGAPLELLSLHVLARAYDSAWSELHGSLPVGPHILPGLGLRIDYPPGARHLPRTVARD